MRHQLSRTGRSAIPRAATSALAAAVFAAAFASTAARAEVIQVPAAAFAGGDARFLDVGLLRGGNQSLYAPLPFQGAGVVCHVTMAYEDTIPTPGIKVSLLRKNVVYGGDAELRPSVLATLQSRPGNYNWVQRAQTSDIADARINAASDYYFIKAEFVGDGGEGVGLLGVMVDVRKEC